MIETRALITNLETQIGERTAWAQAAVAKESEPAPLSPIYGANLKSGQLGHYLQRELEDARAMVSQAPLATASRGE